MATTDGTVLLTESITTTTSSTPNLSSLYVVNPMTFTLSIIILSLGIISNLIIVATICYGKGKRTEISYYQISHFAVANFAYCLFFLLLQIMIAKQSQYYQQLEVLTMINGTNVMEIAYTSPSWFDSLIQAGNIWPYCEICFSMMLTSTTTSTFILTHASINWYKTLKNARGWKALTPKRLLYKVIMMWFSAAIISAPYAMITVTTTSNSSLGCRFENYNSPLLLWYALAVAFSMGFIPVMTMTYRYIKIIRILRQNIQAIEIGIPLTSQQRHYQTKQRSIVKLVMVLSLVYVIFIIPYVVAVVFMSIGRQKYYYDPNDSIYLFQLYTIPSLGVAALFALNPIICITYSQLNKATNKCCHISFH